MGAGHPVWQNMVEMVSDIPTKIIRIGETLEEGKINICSYDTLHTIEDLSCSICIADECHFFLKSKSRRSIAVNRVVADKRIALSATPTMNKVGDMVTILKWVNPQLAKDIMLLVNENSDLELYEQAKILGEELKRRILLLRETHQVGTSIEPFVNYIYIDKKIENPKDLQEIGRVKALYALEYIRSFTNKMVVIFYYKATGEQLKVRLGGEAILVNGESSKQEVKESLEKFERGEARILLGSSVLAEGIDLSHASHILIVEESHYSLRADQLRERCNSIYKDEEVIIDILRIKGGQDDRVYELIENKYDINQGLRDG